jgi:molybdate transport system ATP-binding protein
MTETHTAVEAATLAPRNNEQLQAKVRRSLISRKQEFLVDVDFEANPGFTILFGASGAGKTTVLDCIAGISTPDSGRIAIRQRLLFDSSLRINLPVWTRRCGYVFQTLALFPHMTVEENVAYGLAHLLRDERSRRTANILDALHIAPLARRKALDISGGESQRVALARTLVTDPDLLLLDEPLAALDRPTKSPIIDDLREWNRTHRIPILYVTHSREEVFALGDQVIVLDAGRIVAQGTPHDVLSAPQVETVAQLAGFENIFDAIVEAVRPERGTMTCRIAGEAGGILLETPLVRGGVGAALRVGIRAGDILLATSPPTGLSARNVIPGRIQSLAQHDVIVSALVKGRITMEVHLTLAARDSLELVPGKEVWLVIKTHSCHLMQP